MPPKEIGEYASHEAKLMGVQPSTYEKHLSSAEKYLTQTLRNYEHELAGVHYLLAYIASFVVTTTLGYLLNGRYTFRARAGNSAGLARYMLVNVTLLVINGTALRILVEHFHVWYLTATLLLAALNTPVSFLAHRLVSYRLGLRATPIATEN